MIRQARAAARLIGWCRRALAKGHLVSVAAALHRALGADLPELDALGLPTDLLERFPNWRRRGRGDYRAPARALTLVAAGSARPMGRLRVHLAFNSEAVPLVLPLLRGLDEQLDADSTITVGIEPGPFAAELRRLATRVLRHPRRVRFAVVRSATTFARDHALAARSARDQPVLLLPRGFRPERGHADAALDARRARSALGARLAHSALYWQGGNILVDGYRCLIGADLVRENMARLGLTGHEVLATLAAEFGTPVHVLGHVSRATFDTVRDRLGRSGQASYHIDLDVCPVGVIGRGPPVVLLSDPDLGLPLLPRALADPAVRSAHGLGATGQRVLAREYRRVAAARRPVLARYRRQLERLGYRVIRVPELRTDHTRRLVGVDPLDVSYCNALPALHRGRPALYYLPCGVAALDAAAERAMRRAGVLPVRITSFAPLARGMMRLTAGVHCFCGPLP
jgi:hypothetical protein